MRVATADDLRANLIGAWTLQSYVSVSIDGSDVVYPLGVDARGIIMIAPRVTWTLRTTDESGIPYDFAGGYRALAPL
jgi:hypothetical protein